MHEVPLLINIVVALVVAFMGGVLARRIGLPTIVGYLIAGIVIGPFTPGFVGDSVMISQLAELGVIFLMFGVGLHFSLHDFWKVRSIAIPGALGPYSLKMRSAFLPRMASRARLDSASTRARQPAMSPMLCG